MNIHPFVVHFPIALLIIYSLMEFVYTSRLRMNKTYILAKSLFLWLGTIGAFAASSSGEAIEHMFNDAQKTKIVELHSLFASITTSIFTVLAVCYVIYWFREKINYKSKQKSIKKIIKMLYFFEKVIIETRFVMLSSIIGLITIIITSALGGVLVHGSEVDPFVKFIFGIFF